MTDNTNDPVGVLRQALTKIFAEANMPIPALRIASDALAATTPAAIQHSEQRETVPAGEPKLCIHCGKSEGQHNKMKNCIGDHPDLIQREVFRTKFQPIKAAPVAAPARKSAVQVGAVKWPEGYCTDPNGVIVPPAGKHEDFSFGYDMGYSDGLVAIKDSVKAIEDRVRNNLASPVAAPVPEAKAERPCQYPNCGCTSRASCNKNYRDTAPAVKHEASEFVPATDAAMIERVKQVRQSVGSIMEHTARQDAALARRTPPIAVQGSGDADIEFKRLADAILQAATNTERNDALRLMAALFDSRSPVAAAPEELSKAFITLESNGDGKSRKIVLKFNQRDDAYAVHHFLLNCGEGRALSAAAPSADAKAKP